MIHTKFMSRIVWVKHRACNTTYSYCMAHTRWILSNQIDSWSLYIWSFFSLSCTTEFLKMNGPVSFSSFDLTVSYFIIGSRLKSNTIWNIETKWPRQTTTFTFPVPKINCSRTVDQFGRTNKGSYWDINNKDLTLYF